MCPKTVTPHRMKNINQKKSNLVDSGGLKCQFCLNTGVKMTFLKKKTNFRETIDKKAIECDQKLLPHIGWRI